MNYISQLPYILNQAGKQPKKKRVALMGSTGTIGKNTLAIIKNAPEMFEVYALAGGKNIELLARQSLEFRPQLLGIQHEQDVDILAKLLPHDYQPHIVFGKKGYAFLASLAEIDIVLSAQVGAAGLRATVAAAEAGKTICLANKESLVLAGDLIRHVTQKNKAMILPVDSEHYAIFQCISAQYIQNMSSDILSSGTHSSGTFSSGIISHDIPSSDIPSSNIPSSDILAHDAIATKISHIQRLILTASGGPFRGKDKDFLKNVTKEDALNHPNWKMGAKISIDSASLMNKGLEVIEACHLYGLAMNKIDVLVHPQSIVHSLVEWQDGSILAQLASPDMRLPIGACLAWPHMLNKKINTLKTLDLTKQALTFEEPNLSNFPCLRLAREAFAHNLCIELNAANEIAVELFLQDKIQFTQIAELVENVMQATSNNHIIDFTKISTEDALLQIEERDALSRKLALTLNIK